MAIIGASQLQLHYADLEVFSNVTLQVDEKDRIGLVGPNGSGKTSLIKVLLDLQDYDSGEVFKKDNLLQIETSSGKSFCANRVFDSRPPQPLSLIHI